MLKVPDTPANRKVKKVVDSMALEGMTYDEEFIQDMLDAANGKITPDEVRERIRKRYSKRKSLKKQ